MASSIQYLDQFLDPLSELLTPAVAQKIVDLRADEVLQKRVDYLASKANEGTLTVEEEQEYKSYIEAADMVGILQAKARQFLARNPASHR